MVGLVFYFRQGYANFIQANKEGEYLTISGYLVRYIRKIFEKFYTPAVALYL